MRMIALVLGFASLQVLAQEATETREMIGVVGGRAALIHLHATQRPDGSSRLTGEYLVLPTLQQRFVEGERSKQLGVTFLKEGSSPIFYGRPATATLQAPGRAACSKARASGRAGSSGSASNSARISHR